MQDDRLCDGMLPTLLGLSTIIGQVVGHEVEVDVAVSGRRPVASQLRISPGTWGGATST